MNALPPIPSEEELAAIFGGNEEGFNAARLLRKELLRLSPRKRRGVINEARRQYDAGGDIDVRRGKFRFRLTRKDGEQGKPEPVMDELFARLAPAAERSAPTPDKTDAPLPFVDANGEIQEIKAEIADLKTQATAVEVIEVFGGELKLGRPIGSAFYKLREAYHRDEILLPVGGPVDVDGPYDQPHQIFLIEHDWAAAFARANDFDGVVKLPFEYCCFELRLCGHRVLACLEQNEAHPDTLMMVVFADMTAGWTIIAGAKLVDGAPQQPVDDSRLSIIGTIVSAFIWQQVRAVVIALDAEVAVTDTIRAPHKLNKERERKGKTPLCDYHVVSLAKRARADALPEDHVATERKSPRLHFRRGHWRHYDNHKTWIKWMLVGEPDLGFVDKHYRL